MFDSETKARYIAIADLALKRGDTWSKEFDKERDGYLFYPYFLKRMNEEWKHDETQITAKDYDIVINNTYDFYKGDSWDWLKTVRVWLKLPSVGW